jgi:molybdopterin synthase catalytic subunit
MCDLMRRCLLVTSSPSCRHSQEAEVRHLTHDPIRLEDLIAQVESSECGGVVSFLGTVRNHHGGREVLRLEYEAYQPMAEAECARIIAEAESRWPVAIALQHRLGTLEIGDVAVAIAAASAHRDEAFAACRHVIEELKLRVPIWKREYYADGTVSWVGSGADGQQGRETGEATVSEAAAHGRWSDS